MISHCLQSVKTFTTLFKLSISMDQGPVWKSNRQNKGANRYSAGWNTDKNVMFRAGLEPWAFSPTQAFYNQLSHELYQILVFKRL